MAYDKVVDSGKLDSALSALANSIRDKGNTTGNMGLLNGEMKAAVDAIEVVDVQPLSVTTNGTYTAPTGTAYSPVSVSVSVEASDFYTGTGTPAASFGSVGDFFFVTG